MIKKSLRTLINLKEHKLINNEDIPVLKEVVENFSVAISAQMYDLIDTANPNDPIAKQFIPSAKELLVAESETSDPIGDNVHTTVKGIIHRYPDRCLLTPVHVCPVYCRFCFRREKIGSSAQTMSQIELDHAYDYIAEHKEIWEVILTGGDPLILKPHQLKSIINRLNAIEHVEIIRIHTRIPVVESQRINDEMLDALKCNKTVYIAIHANHPREFTQQAINACASLTAAGITLLSQTTLLKGINDHIDVLSQLMRTFVKNRIKPYYVHHADQAKGTQHFRTTIAEGQKLMKQLRGRFSGICQPTYVLDIPGGYGKVPVSSSYIQDNTIENTYNIEDYCGNKHHYSDK